MTRLSTSSTEQTENTRIVEILTCDIRPESNTIHTPAGILVQKDRSRHSHPTVYFGVWSRVLYETLGSILSGERWVGLLHQGFEERLEPGTGFGGGYSSIRLEIM